MMGVFNKATWVASCSRRRAGNGACRRRC
jgi:hypothetical protein